MNGDQHLESMLEIGQISHGLILRFGVNMPWSGAIDAPTRSAWEGTMKPRCRWNRATASLMVVILLFTGCANDQQRTRGEAIGLGALIGAAAGALLGGNRDSALVGGAIGAVAGAAAGQNRVETKAAYARREDELRASADQALALAQASREENTQRAQAIAALDRSVQRLRNEALSATARRSLAQDTERRQKVLVAQVEAQLGQMRQELARQNNVLAAEQQRLSREAAAQPSEGLRRVSAGVRDLQQQERTLEDALLQLQEIDKRRAY
jgi:hypothetical protein